MKRRILVFTGSRAEYGLFRNVIRILSENDQVELHLLASGTHLSQEYGFTIKEIENDNFAQVHAVSIDLEKNDSVGVCHSMSKGLSGYAEAIQRLAPDILVLLGDRYETFCAAASASILRIPIAHLFGGEATEGAVDDVLRHAITKMSHLHFTACDIYRRRVIQMGENPKHVWCVGSLGVENVHLLPVHSEYDVRTYLNIPQAIPYLVATYHPVTLEREQAIDEVKLLLKVLTAHQNIITVFTGANADAGGQDINILLQDYASSHPNFRFFMSLGVERYINAVRYSIGVVGNSSSGISEVPSLGVPVLDIGNRQKGRVRANSVLHADLNTKKITAALHTMLQPATRSLARDTTNPLDKPHTAQRIADTVATYPLKGLLAKTFFEYHNG
ncbi:UDP-N-acetylglucosamine 2-epimerase [Nitratidesulfovibrio vulgaris]|uniref:UDP-N-acetylglucosamine 2-epimerase n=1 Tax=Nitratidesulfovibrio vulgaris (strain DP4) TaxID=391774 RepID=A0A0H3ACS6_NITV4|nr:UDP-N-acetylglucosamine 2-epimerase [Nitratidesulfovibrio vulgaris]ABM29606.1 UDP-N-acetylglucosamine 2-epimerase [Nitratidesulfovibrio vulgaris DP4]